MGFPEFTRPLGVYRMATRPACVAVTHLKGVRAPRSLGLVGRGDLGHTEAFFIQLVLCPASVDPCLSARESLKIRSQRGIFMKTSGTLENKSIAALGSYNTLKLKS